MNFDFSGEQKLLREQARKFLDANCPRRVRRADLESGAGYDRAPWKGIAEMGWLGGAIPEAHEGFGLGALELCVIAEELGRVLAPVPFSSTLCFFAEALGLVGGGWQSGMIDVKELLALARELELEDGPALKNALVRECIADWYVRSAGLKYTTYRTLTALSRGEQPGPQASTAKLVVATKLQELCAFATELEGKAGVLTGGDAPAHGAFQQSWMNAPSFRIAGGTDEILRNIIAERVLGLPQDVRVDKDVPFNKVPAGR